MASVTSLGMGSGLDLESMVTKLMSAERAPLNALGTKISGTQSKISLFGNINSKLAALKSAAETLQFPARLNAQKATSSDTSTLTATAAFGAANGSHDIKVTQLATAQKSFTAEYSAGTTFDPGSLNFTVGGVAMPAIQLNDEGKTSYTLEEVRDKINSADVGVRATVVNTQSNGQRMILTGTATGAGKGFELTAGLNASGGQPDLVGADFDTTTAGLARSDAQDGVISLDGVSINSSTNTFTPVSGLTVTTSRLSGADAVTVKVEPDIDKLVSAAKALVDSYNGAISIIKSNSGYDSATKSAGALNGDFAARAVANALANTRQTIPSELASANLNRLSDLGISAQQNGQLTLDESKLRAAMSKNPDDVSNVIQAYGKSFSDTISNMNDSQGVLSRRVSSLNDSVKIYKDNQARLEMRMVAIEKRYRAQFTAMDTLVAQMKSTSGSLSQMFSNL